MKKEALFLDTGDSVFFYINDKQYLLTISNLRDKSFGNEYFIQVGGIKNNTNYGNILWFDENLYLFKRDFYLNHHNALGTTFFDKSFQKLVLHRKAKEMESGNFITSESVYYKKIDIDYSLSKFFSGADKIDTISANNPVYKFCMMASIPFDNITLCFTQINDKHIDTLKFYTETNCLECKLPFLKKGLNYLEGRIFIRRDEPSDSTANFVRKVSITRYLYVK